MSQNLFEFPGRKPSLDAAFHVPRSSSDLAKSCYFQTPLGLVFLGTRCLSNQMEDEFLASSAGRVKMGVGTAPSPLRSGKTESSLQGWRDSGGAAQSHSLPGLQELIPEHGKHREPAHSCWIHSPAVPGTTRGA